MRCDMQLSEGETGRIEARKEWLHQIRHAAESAATDIDPVYQAVFHGLRQVNTLFLGY